MITGDLPNIETVPSEGQRSVREETDSPVEPRLKLISLFGGAGQRNFAGIDGG